MAAQGMGEASQGPARPSRRRHRHARSDLALGGYLRSTRVSLLGNERSPTGSAVGSASPRCPLAHRAPLGVLCACVLPVSCWPDEKGDVVGAGSGRVVGEASGAGVPGLRVDVSFKYRRLLVQQLAKHSLISARDYEGFRWARKLPGAPLSRPGVFSPVHRHSQGSAGPHGQCLAMPLVPLRRRLGRPASSRRDAKSPRVWWTAPRKEGQKLQARPPGAHGSTLRQHHSVTLQALGSFVPLRAVSSELCRSSAAPWGLREHH